MITAEKPALPLHTSPVQYFKGVGPLKSQILEKVGIRTIEDLLYYFPRNHQDRRTIPIIKTVPNTKAALRGIVVDVQFNRIGKNLGQVLATLKDASGSIQALWFKRMSFKYDVFSALKRDVQPNRKILVYGSIEWGPGGLQIHVEDHEPEAEWRASPVGVDRITPVYPLTEGLQDRWLRQISYQALHVYSGNLVETLPESIIKANDLMPLKEAVQQYHFPSSWSARDRARHRLAFEEFFHLELALALNRKNRVHGASAVSLEIKKTLLTPFKNQLGYAFTKGQTRVINEIFHDLQKSVPMNRLLQGDVGSGKTVVALSAALLALENNRQTVFLAPTEILAQQHALVIGRLFKPLGLSWALLTGSTPKSERRRIIQGLKNGKIELVVGTHALLNEEIVFRDLGLAIIDEQHRFGVRQRARLILKSNQSDLEEESLLEKTHPHVLIMTATPIPRTLALTLYGDLDISIIDERPGGQASTLTAMVAENAALKTAGEELARGRQVYVVLPLVEESETLSKRSASVVRAATVEFERMKRIFSSAKVGLLHGQLSSEEKSAVMDLFRKGDLQLLVATPVIEVGIDVPNATVIIILNPERFGLAQLHQLRGRVGRGIHPSYCLLVRDGEDLSSNERLTVFCSLYDGFKLAEEDLRLRGPGEFIGENQHGIPFFRVGDLLKDGLLITQARQAALDLVEGVYKLNMYEFDILNRQLTRKFGKKIKLSQIG